MVTATTQSYRSGSLATAVAALSLALALAGCGAGDRAGERKTRQAAGGDAAAGALVFEEAGCADCHTLAEAGSSGKAGPSLDEARPEFDEVARKVKSGGGGMPAFGDRLSERQIRDVAAFVAESTGHHVAAKAVAATFEPDETKLSDCDGDHACYEQAFGNVTYEDGPKTALALFEDELRSPGPIEENCHRIAHTIGAAALARYDGNVGKAFVEGSAACWSGYYHGVLERAFVGVPDDRLGAAARRMCADADIRRVTFVAYQCVHGLGHGLMLYTGYDLPLSLRICDRLATAWDRTSCTGGVFMENISSSYGVESRWLKDDDLIYPCNAVARRHKVYCYLMVTSRILSAVGYDWRKTAAICRRSEPGWVRTCFQSLGRDASGHTRQDPARIAEICRVAGDMERECVYGAARDIASNDAHGRRAGDLCRTVGPRLRAGCFEGVGTILGTLHPSAAGRRDACAAITRKYVRPCLRGAGVQRASRP